MGKRLWGRCLGEIEHESYNGAAGPLSDTRPRYPPRFGLLVALGRHGRLRAFRRFGWENCYGDRMAFASLRATYSRSAASATVHRP